MAGFNNCTCRSCLHASSFVDFFRSFCEKKITIKLNIRYSLYQYSPEIYEIIHKSWDDNRKLQLFCWFLF